MLMPSNQLTAAPPSETRWFLYLPWQPTWILAPGMSLFFSLNLMSCCCLVANLVRLFAIPWAVAHQAPLSMGFPRQEYWSGLPYPSPGNLPDSGIEPASPAWADGFFFFNCWAFREAVPWTNLCPATSLEPHCTWPWHVLPSAAPSLNGLVWCHGAEIWEAIL